MESAPVSTQTLPADTRLEEFVIERVLGSGGFGVTYLARDARLDRKVVIKENLPAQYCFRDPSTLTVSPRHTHGDDADNFRWSLDNFTREAAMLASLDHPGIVKVLRSFEAFGTAYFVMPFVEGRTLDEIAIERKSAGRHFTEDELRSLLGPLLDALGYLHDRGVYHRDIKPGNILITTEGRPVLIDFGSARQRLSERSMTVVESAGYTPFEQLQSRGNVGPWSDLYALAATLAKTITGETLPKANDRVFEDPWQPLASRVALLLAFSPDFLQSIDGGLRQSIEERWQGAKEWKDALAVGSHDEAGPGKTENESSGGVTELPKPSGKRSWTMAIAPVLGTLAAAGYLFLLGGQLREKEELPATALGGLVITSDPSGASLMDEAGNPLGTTPVELKELNGGHPWEGTLKLEGYVASKVVAEVVASETKSVPVKLLPAPQNLVVTSEPAEAEVWEDGKMVGVTPWEGGPRDAESAVRLTLRKSGYLDAEINGKVELGMPLKMHGYLKAQPQMVAVNSDPSGAVVLENNSIIGTTPFSITKMAGDHLEYIFRLDGYQDQVISTEISSTDSSKIFVQFGVSTTEDAMTDEEQAAKDNSLQSYMDLAATGDSESMWKIGRIHEEGIKVPIDQALALTWYKKSADNGSTEGMFLYALAHEFGAGCAMDKEKALYFYKMAAEKEHEESQRRYSLLERELEGGNEDVTNLNIGADRKHLENLQKLRDEPFKTSQESPSEINGRPDSE